MMKDKKLLFWVLTVVVLAIVGCGLFVSKQLTTPSESNFNLIFKYGVGAKNVLNTFEGTYTKDMIVDPPITVKLSLSNEELHKIYQKMIEINFFGYPDRFFVSVPPGEIVCMVTPYYSYYFKVEYNSKIKELWWEDNITNEDKKAEKLRELIKLITDIIKSKEEYKKLPSPRGYYI
ncbi:MAG: hypothetical protein QME40_04140 [bacterium]|nr:hypothetical protein [bacterium]